MDNKYNDDASRSEQDRLMDRLIYPYGDPAIINPEELATFPKPSKDTNYNLDAERDNHSVTKPSPVRSGRNITQTGSGPNDKGFM